MIMPYDQDYQETKQIMLGNTTMKPEFKKLAEWIDKTYGVKTINIFFDTIDEGTRPRLEICFEFEQEKAPFYNKNKLNHQRDAQQAIQDKLEEVLKEQDLLKTGYYFTDNLWVIYGSFAPVAKWEANERVSQEDLLQLKKEINNSDLWEISNRFSGVVFFLHTDAQVKKYASSEARKIWTDKYFDLLNQYNEFGYFKREEFVIELDSKENFDKNYASNWYYYYK